MGEKASNLAIQYADELSATRHSEAEQFLGRKAEGMFLVHGRDIVEPIEIRERLQISLGFDQFLCPAMQQADVRINPHNNLSVKLEDKAKHPMRRRMLRSKIDREIAHLSFRGRKHLQKRFSIQRADRDSAMRETKAASAGALFSSFRAQVNACFGAALPRLVTQAHTRRIVPTKTNSAAADCIHRRKKPSDVAATILSLPMKSEAGF
jgi:hypothetical protein